jgi:hypothetical protein
MRLFNNPRFYLIGIAFLFITAAFTIRTEFQEYCEFRKDSGQMQLKTRSALFMNDLKVKMLQDIEKVEVEECGDGMTNESYYKVFLVIKYGDRISLQITGSQSNLCEMAESINHFLGVSSAID